MRHSGLGALTTVWVIALLSSTATATATSVNIDEFSVASSGSSGSSTFDDSFQSNTPLVGGNGTLQQASVNFGNGNTANYFVHGTIPQTTANNGQATINTANGIVKSQPAPFLSTIQTTNAFLQTGTSSTNVHALTPSTTFTTSGLFDLAVPTTPLGTYDITLTNRVTANNDLGNQLELRVRQCVAGSGLCGTTSGPVLQFYWANFVNNTQMLIAQVALTAAELLDPQILLEFQKLSTTSDAITALYAFGSGNTLGTFNGTLVTLGTTDASTDVFTTADPFVLPGFEAFDPITTPLPAALPLFATGIGAMGLIGWRRKRKMKAVA